MVTTPLPSGVVAFNADASKRAAASNFTVSIHGGPKMGKSHFAFMSERPLYLVYLDTNPNVHSLLLKSSEVMGDEVYQLIITPKPYKDLSVQDAQGILDQIESFRDWAIQNALSRVLEGKHGGTFVVDGMYYFRGYCEKAILGESVVLGWRPKQGESTNISTYDYAKSNAAVFEFVASFVNKPLDAVFTWEGRPIYKDVIDSRNRVQSKRTDAYRSTRPDRMPHMLSAELEALKTLDRLDPSNNQSPLITTPRLRVVLTSETLGMDQMVIPSKTFAEFKRMMLSPTVGDLDELRNAVPASAVIRANEAGFPTTELAVENGAEDDD